MKDSFNQRRRMFVRGLQEIGCPAMSRRVHSMRSLLLPIPV